MATGKSKATGTASKCRNQRVIFIRRRAQPPKKKTGQRLVEGVGARVMGMIVLWAISSLAAGAVYASLAAQNRALFAIIHQMIK